MSRKVFNMQGGRHSDAALSAFLSAAFNGDVAAGLNVEPTGATGLKVLVKPGTGQIKTGQNFSRLIQIDADEEVTIAAASPSNERHDLIVAYIDSKVTPTTTVIDNTNGVLKLASVAGTPSATPTDPTTATIQSKIGAGNPYIILARVTVPQMASSLTKSNITDLRSRVLIGNSSQIGNGIIESLKMTPVKYIGNVKRGDITFDVRKHAKDHAYKEEKLQTAAESINTLAKKGDKTLVYVPYTRHIADLYAKMNDQARVGKYAGNMTPGEKNETLKSIKDGSKNVVLATKAFGMGIDIDDIKNVYHFAPTGNVADYVQEIGRAARKPNMTGVASTDFFKEDFRYIKQLHGMSSIKNYQVKAALQKIYELYVKYNKRNFLVSPDEFSYIFANAQPNEIDAKLKTTLLIIKKDFEMDSTLNYVPLVFKPRSMFTVGYFMINDDFIPELQQHGYLRFFTKLDLPRITESPGPRGGAIVTTRSPGDTYRLDFKSMWEQKYRDVSFGMFKRGFYMGELLGFDFRISGDNRKIINRVVIEVDSGNKFFGELKRELVAFFDIMKEIFDDLKQDGKHFSTDELSRRIIDRRGVSKKHIADMVAASFMYLLARVEENNNFNFSNFFEYNSVTNKYVIKNTSYERRLYALKKIANIMLADDTKTKTVRYSTKMTDDKQIIVGQIMELLEVADCKISSGSNPEFFVRVNNPYAIERIINNPTYMSQTVALVGKKHRESCELMSYFFDSLHTDTERWDFIEKYFLGQLDENTLISREGQA